MSSPNQEGRTAKHLAYWNRYASRYDLSLRLLRRPLPRMLELIAEATEGAERVLEVAAGTGLVTPTLAETAREVVATDYAEAMLERLQTKVADQGLSNVQCEQADIYALPYDPHSFDVVVAANVLHIVPDLEKALSELKKMLKPGGLLIAPTFCHDETRVSWLMSRLLAITAFPGQRRFTSSALAEALTESGFSVSRSETLPGLIPIGYVQATATTSIREVVDEATK